jgi:GxxExxY protein
MQTKHNEASAVTEAVIGCAIRVHRGLGPGLLESAYEACLAYEMSASGLLYERQRPLPVVYKGVRLDCGYRLDFVVADIVVVEIKAIERFAAVHDAQLLTYLRLSGLPVGLLLNFNVEVLRDGIRRRVQGL